MSDVTGLRHWPRVESVMTRDGYLFGKRTTMWGFSLFVAMMILDFADRMIMASLLPLIKTEWHISDTQAGMLNSVLFVGMMIFSFPASLAIDRWSRVKTAALMGGFWSFASGAGAFAQNINQLAVSRAAVGCAQAGYSPAAAAWIMAAFPKRRVQLALGTFSAGQPIGMALGVALGGYIASNYGWRHALGIMAFPGFLIAVLLYRARDYKNPTATALGKEVPAPLPTPTLRASLVTIFKTPTLPWIYLYGAMMVMQMSSVIYFLPSFLNGAHRLPVETASYMTSSVLMVGVIGAPLGGWLIDLWGTRYGEAKVMFPLLAALVGIMLYIIAFGLTDSMMLQYGCILGGVFLVTSGSSGPFAASQELVHPGIRALSMTCYALTSHLLGSLPGPALTGVISDHTNLKFALLSAAVFSGVITVVVLFFAKRHYMNDLARIGAPDVMPD